jgi:hypothetical protein
METGMGSHGEACWKKDARKEHQPSRAQTNIEHFFYFVKGEIRDQGSGVGDEEFLIVDL